MRKMSFFFALMLLALDASGQRLPADIALPQHYQITLAPDFQKDNFRGEETLRIRVLKPTSSITLNSAEITYGDATITQAGSTQTAKVTPDPKLESAVLTVEKPLSPGEASIHIRYTGILNNQMRGFYLSKTEKRKYAATQFENTDARRAFPSFDQPDMKATFDVSAVIDKGDIAISNGKVVSDTPGPGAEKHTVKFSTTPKMSSYLVALLVGDFECESGQADGIPIRVCGTPERKGMGQFALKAAEYTMHFYNRYFGVKYPYAKLDFIGLPDYAAGAMENTACIVARDAILFVDPKSSSYLVKKEVAQVAAHEMAHQWFGDLVTMKWWDDIWLNEGFATWMSFKPIEAYKPEWNLQEDEVQSAAGAMETDALNSTHPIRQHAETPAEIQELFDSISYNKAAATLRMIEGYVGPEIFRKGVNAYLSKYSYGNATSEDFWTSIAQVSHKPIDKIMATFVVQPGVPVVSATSSCRNGAKKVVLSQKRYFENRELFNNGSPEQWQIPVCLKAGAGEKCELLTKKSQEIELSGCGPVYANAGARGYYRSSYDAENLHQLAASAEQILSPVERIQLVGDIWAQTQVGGLKVGDFLGLAEGLKNDPSRAVIDNLMDPLRHIHLYLATDADRAQYEAWVRNTFGPVGEKLGWTPGANDSEEARARRADLFALVGDVGRDPKLIPIARELVQKSLRGETVDNTLIYPALTIAAHNGDAALYDRILERTHKPQSPEDYTRMLRTLGYFEDPALIQRSLEYAVSDQVRSQDAPFLLGRLMRNPAARSQAWNFIREHWPQVEAKLSNYSTGSIVYMASHFCDAGARDQVQEFFTQHPIPSAERALKQTVESINNCIVLRQQQQKNLASWLKQQSAGATAGGQ